MAARKTLEWIRLTFEGTAGFLDMKKKQISLAASGREV